MAECPGIHAMAPQAGCERLDWNEPTGRCQRIRVRAHTCDCRGEFFEFCTAGGLFFIRWHRRGVVRETAWVSSAEGERTWRRVLTGAAR